MNRGGCEVCVCSEVDELRSQVSRLQSRNRELELQSSGRNSDHARQIRQVTAREGFTKYVSLCMSLRQGKPYSVVGKTTVTKSFLRLNHLHNTWSSP